MAHTPQNLPSTRRPNLEVAERKHKTETMSSPIENKPPRKLGAWILLALIVFGVFYYYKTSHTQNDTLIAQKGQIVNDTLVPTNDSVFKELAKNPPCKKKPLGFDIASIVKSNKNIIVKILTTKKVEGSIGDFILVGLSGNVSLSSSNPSGNFELKPSDTLTLIFPAIELGKSLSVLECKEKGCINFEDINLNQK